MRLNVLCSIILSVFVLISGEDVRLDNLDPPEAQQLIESKDQTLKYAPKVETNVPATRFIGNEPQQVLEDIYLANQYHGQDGLGGYVYGYSVPDIAKTEKKKAGGDLRGAYNYISGDGQEIKVEYWDDGTGFHQIDNVPKILPQQIEDSPEVKAAKDEHARIWAEEAERNSKPIQNPYPDTQPGAYAGLGAGVGAGVGVPSHSNAGQSGGFTHQGGYKQQSGFNQQGGYNQQSGFNQQTGYSQQANKQPAGAFAGQSNYGGHGAGSQQISQSTRYTSGYNANHGGQQNSPAGGVQSQTGYSAQTTSSVASQGSNPAAGVDASQHFSSSAVQQPNYSGGFGQVNTGASASSSHSNQPQQQQSPAGQNYQSQGGFSAQSSSSWQNKPQSYIPPAGQAQGQATGAASTPAGQYNQPQSYIPPAGQAQGQVTGAASAPSAQYNQPQHSAGQYNQQQSQNGQYNQPQQGSGQAQSYQASQSSYSSQSGGSWQNKPQAGGYQGSGFGVSQEHSGQSKNFNDNGEWKEDDEEKGPPKGFFYNFDYPVGIIVSKQGVQQKRESLTDIYNTNKQYFEQQLKGGAAVHGGTQYPNYQVHA